jgi:hypothetical protein
VPLIWRGWAGHKPNSPWISLGLAMLLVMYSSTNKKSSKTNSTRKSFVGHLCELRHWFPSKILKAPTRARLVRYSCLFVGKFRMRSRHRWVFRGIFPC